MATLNRPPADITPREFFETWLPGEYERLSADAPKPPDMAACVRLSGDGGGAWTLRLSGGGLAVAAADTADAEVVVEQSVDDWRAVTVGAVGGGPDMSLPDSASLESWLFNPALQQALQSVKGSLRFEIPGFEGRTFAVGLKFRGADEPQATITIDMDTIVAMRDGSLPPMQAFFAGKILIAGDSAFAMQLGMSLMPQNG